MAEQHSPRVLIIDDEPANRYIFRRILTGANFVVDEATNGREGMEKALSGPDIIICDVNLPDILGYDLCRRLKSNSVSSSIPILQISASFVSDESRVQALDGGADSYLVQPVEPAVLIAQLRALLRLRKAEALSHLSALRWQSTFDALSDGLALADRDGNVIRANGAFCEMLGLASYDIEGTVLADFFASRFDVPLATFLERTPAARSSELQWNGRWFRVRLDTIQSGPESSSGTILIVTDITDNKKLQEMLRVSERLAATGRLAHVIAHEINNPLEALSNLLYLSLGTTAANPEANSYVKQASLELLRISTITKQVLSYHRDSSEPVVTQGSELLESALAMFRSQALTRGIHISRHLECGDLVHVHPGEIRQVFGNLIANAIDAIESPPGRLLVGCLRSLDVRNHRRGVRFVFSDSGTGISEHVLPRIYDAFYTTKESRGSGIGLWLSADVIGRHAGNIRVRTRTSGPYRGTLFDIFLPLANNNATSRRLRLEHQPEDEEMQAP